MLHLLGASAPRMQIEVKPIICAYFYETGHSSDERQRSTEWLDFSPGRRLGTYRKEVEGNAQEIQCSILPYERLRAPSGAFADWSESKRQLLLGKLLTHLENINPIPTPHWRFDRSHIRPVNKLCTFNLHTRRNWLAGPAYYTTASAVARRRAGAPRRRPARATEITSGER